MTVDLAVTETIQSGGTAEYMEENRDRPAKIAILFVGILTIVTLSLRFLSRWSVRRLGIDDAFAGLSLLLQIAFIVLAEFLIDIGTGRHLQYIEYVMTPAQTKKSEILDFSAHLIYTTALFFCRLSGLAFYRRLCEPRGRLSLAIKCALLLLIAVYLPQMLLIIFHCKPVTALWPYPWELRSGNHFCLRWGLVYTVNSALSLLCDIFMFAIPVGLIRALSLPIIRKLQLYLVLLPGVLVIIISSVRIYLVVEGEWSPDSSWDYDPMLAIENAEIGGTLIALSVPVLKPFVDSMLSKLRARRPHRPPSSTSRNPSAIFASDASTSTVRVGGSALVRLPAAGNGRDEVNMETTNMIYQVPAHTIQQKPWRESLGGSDSGASNG